MEQHDRDIDASDGTGGEEGQDFYASYKRAEGRRRVLVATISSAFFAAVVGGILWTMQSVGTMNAHMKDVFVDKTAEVGQGTASAPDSSNLAKSIPPPATTPSDTAGGDSNPPVEPGMPETSGTSAPGQETPPTQGQNL